MHAKSREHERKRSRQGTAYHDSSMLASRREVASENTCTEASEGTGGSGVTFCRRHGLRLGPPSPSESTTTTIRPTTPTLTHLLAWAATTRNSNKRFIQNRAA